MVFHYRGKNNYIKIMDTLKIRFESQKSFDQHQELPQTSHKVSFLLTFLFLSLSFKSIQSLSLLKELLYLSNQVNTLEFLSDYCPSLFSGSFMIDFHMVLMSFVLLNFNMFYIYLITIMW